MKEALKHHGRVLGPIRCFQVFAFNEECFVFARSASKARYAVFRVLQELGYGPKFGDISVNRCGRFDNKTASRIEGRCYSHNSMICGVMR